MSSTQARNYHSVNFGDKNSWDDWYLIPASRPEFREPEGKSQWMDIPGHVHNKRDITYAVVPYPTYKNRTGSFTFIVDNDHGNWADRYNEIGNYLHGKRMRCILDDDPNFFYEGLFKINQWQSNKDWSQIVIDYNVDPYKKEVVGSLDDWLWDPFVFATGIINNGKNISVNGSATVTFTARQERLAPTFIASSQMQVLMNGMIFVIPAGTSRNPMMALQPGDNTMVIHGNGTVSIDYRGGML